MFGEKSNELAHFEEQTAPGGAFFFIDGIRAKSRGQ